MKLERLALICYGLADVVAASPELGIKLLRSLGDACMDEHKAREPLAYVPFVPPAPPKKGKPRK